MLIRIVKLTLRPENISSFEALFQNNKETIRNFEGCQHLELYQDQKQPHIWFTYSYWEKEAHLEAYRKSDFFKSVWSRTKSLFADKAEAWSVSKIG